MAWNREYMERAIQLAANGFPAPNPHVGCVIVKDGVVVGQGYHDYAGGPHAERVALTEAGSLARGADVYVTLEPCNHNGRTPPCSEALIQAGVRRVAYACADPNPRAMGGAARLREAGIEAEAGLCEKEAATGNLRFLAAQRLRRPFVVVKSAASFDGRTALPTGESKWITGALSREQGQRLRAESGAVLVGYRTVLADDPELTARIEEVINQPTRIVLDPDSRLTGKEKVFNDAAPTLHITGRPIRLNELLTKLFEQGLTGLLVEGGARTVGQFWQQGLVDWVELFIGPKVLGAGKATVEGFQIQNLAEAPELCITSVGFSGQDARVSAIPLASMKRLEGIFVTTDRAHRNEKNDDEADQNLDSRIVDPGDAV